MGMTRNSNAFSFKSGTGHKQFPIVTDVQFRSLIVVQFPYCGGLLSVPYQQKIRTSA